MEHLMRGIQKLSLCGQANSILSELRESNMIALNISSSSFLATENSSTPITIQPAETKVHYYYFQIHYQAERNHSLFDYLFSCFIQVSISFDCQTNKKYPDTISKKIDYYYYYQS